VQRELITQPLTLVGGLWGHPLRVRGPVDTGKPILDPILVVPPTSFFTSRQGVLVIEGEAPSAQVNMFRGSVPTWNLDQQLPNPLHLVFPLAAASLRLRSTGRLLYSLGAGSTVNLLPAGEERVLYGSISEICLSSDSTTVAAPFTLEASVNNLRVRRRFTR
jgi:hypothetical protein